MSFPSTASSNSAPSKSPSSSSSSSQQQQQPRTNGSSSSSSGSKHRRSSSKVSNNSNRRSNSSENVKQNKLSASELEIVSQHMDDRTLYLLSNAIGSKCIVTVASGSRYLGLLYTTSSFTDSNNLSIVLKLPELYSLSPDDELDPNDELPDTMIIDFKDFADLEILDLDLTFENNSSPTREAGSNAFKTDTDISSSKIASEQRELEKWVPEEADFAISGGLEDDNTDSKTWDQFAVNERKFGIQSSFNEDLYTTRISKDDPKYKERLQLAEKIAHEIENSSYNGNIHLAEERGIAVDDSGVDEEDKYSGVDRRGEELMAAIRSGASSATKPQTREFSPNKYVPPRQRAAQYHDDPAVLSSSATQQQKVEEDKKIANKLPATLPHKPSSGTVKQTFNSETSRINAQSEINALKEFSATFKIPTKFPKDLLPIVTKDKSKQDEIVKKFEEEELKKKQELEKNEKEQDNLKAAPTPLKKKMDPKTAITFKMSANTPTFQPSNFNMPRSSFSNKSPGTIHSSPRLSQPSPSKKAITPLGFFGPRVPKDATVKSGDEFKNSFNFISHINGYENLEKPFVTPPTWEQEVDESYITFYELVPEKVGIPSLPPPPPNMRYYPPTGSAIASPMGGPPPQLIPGVSAPLSPSHHHHPSQSPIPIQTPIHPQQVPIMMPPNFQNASTDETGQRNLSPSPQLISPYYPGFIPGGPPNMVPQPPQQQQQQQQPMTSPRQQRHHNNGGGNNNRHNHHHHNHNHHNNYQQQQQQQLLQGQYPMVIPMLPPQGGQYGRGAPVNYPAMGYYVVGPPNMGGRQF